MCQAREKSSCLKLGITRKGHREGRLPTRMQCLVNLHCPAWTLEGKAVGRPRYRPCWRKKLPSHCGRHVSFSLRPPDQSTVPCDGISPCSSEQSGLLSLPWEMVTHIASHLSAQCVISVLPKVRSTNVSKDAEVQTGSFFSRLFFFNDRNTKVYVRSSTVSTTPIMTSYPL